MELKNIADINQYVGSSINPHNTPEIVYELYSVPSFDSQYPEILKGSDIGSTKATVEGGDVLICKINPRINRVWVVKHHTEYPLLASSEWIVVRNSEIDSNYLKWYFSSPPFRKLLVSQVAGIGGSLTRAQPKQVAKYPVPVPDFSTQQAIASILDKLDFLISLRKQQLVKLGELVKARFVEMFGDLVINTKEWTFQKLSTLCDVRDGTHDSPEYVSEGYPLLTSQNFTSGIIDFTDCNLISEENFEQINRRSKVDCGDIIMPMIGTIGHPVIVDTNRPFAIKNVALIKFNKEEISNIFVKTVLDSDYFLNVTTANNRGGTQKFIALGDIRNIPIPIVPRECQVVFADFAEEVARQKLTIQQSLDKLEVLKKSLMQEYFG